MLSRTQELTKCYFQMGATYGIPMDILKIIYRIKVAMDREEMNKERVFQRNLILGVHFTTPANASEMCDGEVESSIKKGVGQWMYENTSAIATDPRKKLNGQIKIIGEENYLCVKKNSLVWRTGVSWNPRYDDGDHVEEWIECPLWKKRLYLNRTSWSHMLYDYNNYLGYKGTGFEDSWRLGVDDYGDATYKTET